MPLLGDSPVDVPLLLPEGNAVSTALTFVDASDVAVDQSASTFAVTLIDTPTGWTSTVIGASVSTNVITLAASAAAVDAAIGTRSVQSMRWVLRNTTTGFDILSGPVQRRNRGHGVSVGAGTGVTVQITSSAVTIKGPAATVVTPVANIDGGNASTTYPVSSIDGGSA